MPLCICSYCDEAKTCEGYKLRNRLKFQTPTQDYTTESLLINRLKKLGIILRPGEIKTIVHEMGVLAEENEIQRDHLLNKDFWNLEFIPE